MAMWCHLVIQSARIWVRLTHAKLIILETPCKCVRGRDMDRQKGIQIYLRILSLCELGVVTYRIVSFVLSSVELIQCNHFPSELWGSFLCGFARLWWMLKNPRRKEWRESSVNFHQTSFPGNEMDTHPVSLRHTRSHYCYRSIPKLSYAHWLIQVSNHVPGQWQPSKNAQLAAQITI